ncbi:MAG: DUF937 domain-containing protein [Beijerinckiaceae bacterium]
MMNLFDMMTQAQGGNAMQNLARQYGLSPEQTQSAIESLLPAMSMGMQRQTESVDGLQNFMQMFGGGQYAGFHDADGDGIPDNAVPQGNDVLGALFGSKDMSRAVAAQASAVSGVSDTILKQMMPVIASMLMGGLFKGAMGNGLGGMMGQAMQGGLGNMMGGMMGGGYQQPQQQPQNPLGGLFGGAGNPMANNPMGGLLGNILGGLMGGGRQAPPPAPAPDPMMAGLDMLKGMFQTGQQANQGYQDNLQQMFEQFSQRR